MTRTSADLGFAPLDRLLVTCGPAALGLLLAAVLPAVARWALGLGVVLPFRVVFELVGRVDTRWEFAVLGTILVVVGLFATAALFEHLTPITVAFDQVRFGRTAMSRSAITALFLEGDTLVVLDRESRQVVRCEPRARRSALAATFPEFGYPWRDADPYADLYRPWQPDGELPPEADAVLSARAVVLTKKAGKEAGELRAALERLGYSVRDEGGRQFWRPLVRSA
ncbi:hypothetical protein GCM10010168_81160 [Actinoplanes ianthinogenes]|uniref:DUF308 domain-containing protein n=1 Tax=Actinoplanes ianthinogenes TaxID=122358 RepID=A0ABM7LMW2_9ACTN|nr:hypothetical protein [Actinoplanes ianthinogenes]BCJ40550.1 hypothetical protein Aiant_12070 [Actinoplanes ianthinogenes]GGR50168.1 hypothetical protein GCM10010168_81160 [Actinoplanes ianthinogenes]